MHKRLILLAIAMIMLLQGSAQELDMTVKVIAPNLGTSDKAVVGQMEKLVKEFMNNQKWTGDKFELYERIKSSVQITIREDRGNNSFVCDFAIQASRPVYQSTYETPILILNEKDVPINFDPFKPLENSKETFFDNLSSVLTFYAYFMLSLDYDSFSLEGGEPYVNILQNMVNTIPSGARGFDQSWSSSSSKKNSRYFLMENLINPRMKAFRRAFYEYHRLCLDQSTKDMNVARRDMVAAINAIAQTDRSYPNTYLMQIFINSKSGEIIEIFKKGTTQEKDEVYRAMTAIDPSNSSQYKVLKS